VPDAIALDAETGAQVACASVNVLPPPEVSGAAYDEPYFLGACVGYEEWRAHNGEQVSGRYPGVLALAGLRADETLVDVGAGRGELVACAGRLGARAIGIEYSEAALALAQRTLAAHGHPSGVQMVAADARALPLEDECADLVTMLDVIEHLTDVEQAAALAEAHRILRPGGRLLIHTMPNRLIYDVTYRIQRAWHPGRRRHWPRDPRNDYERQMHVGEQTARSLRARVFAAGLTQVDVRHGEMVYVGHVPDERAHATYHRLAAHRLTQRFGRNDLWARAVKAG
jgi:ubiquinone/menaquinone biosynthesis C-methylase UbiE